MVGIPSLDFSPLLITQPKGEDISRLGASIRGTLQSRRESQAIDELFDVAADPNNAGSMNAIRRLIQISPDAGKQAAAMAAESSRRAKAQRELDEANLSTDLDRVVSSWSNLEGANTLEDGQKRLFDMKADFAKNKALTPDAQNRINRDISELENILNTQGIDAFKAEIDNDLRALAPRNEQLKARIAVKKRPALQENLIAAGLTPGTPEFEKAIMDNLGGGTTVNIDQGGQNKEQEELAKLRAKELKTLRDDRVSAIDINQSLDVLENIDVNTGALEPAKQAMAKFGQAFGFDTSGIANVPAGEAFNAEAKKLVLGVKATQKGPQTDKDEKTIEETVVNLGNTQAGNQFIIDAARALNNRKVEQADFFDEFLDENGTLRGANKEWAKFKRETPMLSPTRKTSNGLPIFFYKFEDQVRNANPDANQQDILDAWRKFNAGEK